MGHKVDPKIWRIPINESHDSSWFALDNCTYSKFALQDVMIREFLRKRLANASPGTIRIDRSGSNKIMLLIEAAKPGLVVGYKGKEIQELRDVLSKKFDAEVSINVVEIRAPDCHPVCIATRIAQQLEARMSHRKLMKSAVNFAARAGVQGISVTCKGRISQIARTEKRRHGSVALGTLRHAIKSAVVHAVTRNGTIGVRVAVSDSLVKKERI